MLVLARKSLEAVVVGGASSTEQFLKVTVLEIRGRCVRLGFEADATIPVHRAEVWERMCAEEESDRREPNAAPTKRRGPYID